MKKSLLYNVLSLMLVVIVVFPVLVQAQTAEIPQYRKTYQLHSGYHQGRTGTANDAVYTETVKIPGASWVRLNFSNAYLGEDSYLVITALRDGAQQRLDAVSLAQWQNTSAYFNGDAVEVALYAGSNDKGVFLEMEEVVAGENIGPLSQCGPTDDRVPSNNPATGRLLNVGCTGWIIDNGLNVTAGHCSGGSANVLQFNVPPSNPNGTINHPGPEDQYSVDPKSKKSTNGGIGNDWGIFRVFANSVTGLMPIEAQGASFTVVQNLGPANIRITGYGVDFNDPTRNQTQQTHVGPNAGSSGTTMRYQTDTEGGNSGSPVIDNATGNAVGVHTHGGCSTSGGGNNSGTSTFHSAFWNALNPAFTVDTYPDNPPAIIPAGGGFLNFHADVTNNTNSSQTVQLWNSIILPIGEEIGPQIGPNVLSLAPGQTQSVALSLEVPSKPPAATYTLTIKVGSFPNTVEASDGFNWTKSAGPSTASFTAQDMSEGWRVFERTDNEATTIANVPETISLEQNYPNPFNPSTVIRYGVDQDTWVQLKVYNVLGQEIATLVNGFQTAGFKDIVWNGTNEQGQTVSAGIYLYKITAGDVVKINKMIFAK